MFVIACFTNGVNNLVLCVDREIRASTALSCLHVVPAGRRTRNLCVLR